MRRRPTHSTQRSVLIVLLFLFSIACRDYVNRRLNQKRAVTEEAMARMASNDADWNEARLESMVRDDFVRIKEAWCDKNLGVLRQRLGVPSPF